MKYTGPKIKKARRLGVAITPKSDRYLERRPNPPGQHAESQTWKTIRLRKTVN